MSESNALPVRRASVAELEREISELYGYTVKEAPGSKHLKGQTAFVLVAPNGKPTIWNNCASTEQAWGMGPNWFSNAITMGVLLDELTASFQGVELLYSPISDKWRCTVRKEVKRGADFPRSPWCADKKRAVALCYIFARTGERVEVLEGGEDDGNESNR